jgi:hypothetical protein
LPFVLEFSADSDVVLTLDHLLEALQRFRKVRSPSSFEADPKILLRNVERRDCWGSLTVEGPASGIVSLRFCLEGN